MEESLGNTLRTARNSAGISVDDAVYLAKIPRSVVLALESEDFGFFTSPLYARSFLKQYSEYIGADVDAWLDDLVPTTLIDSENVESFINIAEPVAAVVSREKNKTKSSGGSAWAALWMTVITGGLLWGGMKIYENFESKHAAQQPAQSDVSTDLEATAAPEVEPSEETPQPESKPIASTVPESPPRAIPVLPEGE